MTHTTGQPDRWRRSFAADFDTICARRDRERALLDAKTGRAWSYASVQSSVGGFMDRFAETGLHPGDRVFSILPNGVEQLVAFLAALRYGVDFCPMSPLSTRGEITRFISLSRAALGLVPEQITESVFEELASATVGRRLLRICTDGDLDRYHGYQLDPSPRAAGKLIISTSGTTSNPKAMVIDGDTLWSSATAWVDFHGLSPDARFYNILPMSYLGGLFNLGLIPIAAGGSVVVSDAFGAHVALRFWKEVREHNVTVLWLAPSVLRALAELRRGAPGRPAEAASIEFSFLGMAPITSAEKARFETEFGIPLLENFALSETTFLTSETARPRVRSPGSVGQVLPWVDMRFGELADSAEASEILVRTPFLFDGYLGRNGGVTPVETHDGYFRTGDLGKLDEHGNLVLHGRLKDVVKKGGYLIVLRDLEELCGTHPAVVEAAAIPVTHDFYGESAALYVQLTPEAGNPDVVLGELRDLITKELAKFRWPSEIIAVPQFPRTANQKVQKLALRGWAASEGNTLSLVRLS